MSAVIARHDAICKWCRLPIRAWADEIARDPKGRWLHVACAEKAERGARIIAEESER